MTFSLIRSTAAFRITLSLLLWPTFLAAQTSPPPPATANAAAWAGWVNSQLPQSIPVQTIVLGAFQMSPDGTGRMIWSPSGDGWTLYGCPPGGGGLVLLNPPVCLSGIDSFNVQYQILVSKPANFDLQVVLSVPHFAGGSSEVIAGTVQDSSSAGTNPSAVQSLFHGASLATVAYHPHSVRPQTLTFSHGGTVMNCAFGNVGTGPCSFTIKPYLTPQLGAFVVPYVPVTVVYQPPGCGKCPDGTTCGSTAKYTKGTSSGATYSWGTSISSGTVKDEGHADFYNDVNAALGLASFVGGAVGGPGVSAAFDTMGKIASTLAGIDNTEPITTDTKTSGQTESRGWVISDSDGFGTSPCSDDLFVYLEDVLFAYAVVPKDPVSGNIVADGELTVTVAPIKYAQLQQVPLSQLQSVLPAQVLNQFLALDLRLNPKLLQAEIALAQQGSSNSSLVSAGPLPTELTGGLTDLKGTGMGRPRLVLTESGAQCPPTSHHFIQALEAWVYSSEFSQATTQSTDTNVTGFLASLTGRAGETIESVTYSSARTNWNSVTQESGLDLICPGSPNLGLLVDVYFDKVFGNLLAVANGVDTGQPPIAGTILGPQGQPAGKQGVVLQIGGRRYRVSSDAEGKFAFRSQDIPKGSGFLIAGTQSFPITYNGTPLANQKFKIGSGMGATSIPGKTVGGAKPGNAVNPPTACCPITSIDAAAGVVTAKTNDTGQSFQFTVKDPAVFHSLKVGQGVFANFKTRQVSVNGKDTCCSIIGFGHSGNVTPIAGANMGGATKQAAPIACCAVTSVDAASAVATARVNSGGQFFQFTVNEPALLNALKVGDAVYANFKTRQVSLNGKDVCCSITNLGQSADKSLIPGADLGKRSKVGVTTLVTGEVQRQLEIFRQKVQLLASKLQSANVAEAQKANAQWKNLVTQINQWATQNNIATESYRQPAGGGGGGSGGGPTGGNTGSGSGPGSQTSCAPEKFSGPFWCILQGAGKDANGAPVCMYQCFKIFH